MDQRQEKVQLSRRWKLFQLYALQVALGSLSGMIILNLSFVEKIFTRIHMEAVYAWFLASTIVVGVLSFMCSGGIGLFRLVNAKRLLKLMEKEESDDGI